jgi:alkylresorcinol/alkylpyrone synthase
VLEAFSSSLGLADGALSLSWRSMAAVGNLSSSSVLHVLADSLAIGGREAGDTGMLFALGPGLSAELILLRWAGDSGGADGAGAEGAGAGAARTGAGRAVDAPANAK